MDKLITSEDIVANEENLPNKEKKRKKAIYKYVIYISLVLIATGIALFLALYKDPVGVFNSLRSAQWQWVLIIVGVVVLSFLVDALVIFIFMRLYTRKYHIHQGLAVSMIGSFYGCITPGAKGGQVMQAYALKNQGTQISNAASILVMYFILYQVALVIFNFVAVIFKFNLLTEIGNVPLVLGNWSGSLSLIPLTIIGFVFSLSIIGILFLMSYSHRIHNFIMHYGVGILAKVKILKHPDQTRESLRIQVENFKIELRRLLSNIPITITILILFFFAQQKHSELIVQDDEVGEFEDEEIDFLYNEYPGLISSLFATLNFSSPDAEKILKQMRIECLKDNYVFLYNDLISKFDMKNNE